jgi:hypothetical protein
MNADAAARHDLTRAASMFAHLLPTDPPYLPSSAFICGFIISFPVRLRSLMIFNPTAARVDPDASRHCETRLAMTYMLPARSDGVKRNEVSNTSRPGP